MKTSGLITRRGAIITGLASVGGFALARRFPKRLPPTWGNVLRMGDSFTYGAQRALLGQSLVREYSLQDVTSFPATGTTDPGAPTRRSTRPLEGDLNLGFGPASAE